LTIIILLGCGLVGFGFDESVLRFSRIGRSSREIGGKADE
jgi:hypothetical protein